MKKIAIAIFASFAIFSNTALAQEASKFFTYQEMLEGYIDNNSSLGFYSLGVIETLNALGITCFTRTSANFQKVGTIAGNTLLNRKLSELNRVFIYDYIKELAKEFKCKGA